MRDIFFNLFQFDTQGYRKLSVKEFFGPVKIVFIHLTGLFTLLQGLLPSAEYGFDEPDQILTAVGFQKRAVMPGLPLLVPTLVGVLPNVGDPADEILCLFPGYDRAYGSFRVYRDINDPLLKDRSEGVVEAGRV